VKVSRRAITIIFGILALSFALGTILLFTPKGQRQSQGRALLWVNGKPLYELDLARLQQQDPLFGLAPEGTLKPLIDTHFLERVILFEALSQDASRVRVSSAEVKAEVDRIRKQFGLTDNRAYDRFLQQIGFTDSLLRREIRRQLQIQKRIDQIRKKVTLTDEEARFFFELHKAQYAPEDKVLARQIVVEDKALADKILKELQGGASFIDLAKKYSKVGAEEGGALGAQPGSTVPGPVTRVVFPEAVANAVFKLTGGGLTPVIEAGGRYYIVQVEKFLPGGEAKYEEVADRVKKDALQIKQQGAVEKYMEEVRKRAQVKFAENLPYDYKNPVVAKVNDTEIKLEEVSQVVFGNPQVPGLIRQGLGELVVQFFYPTTLNQLITNELFYQAAIKSGQPFIGPKAQIASDAQLWKTKDITVSDAEVKAYYEKNKARFRIPAKAVVALAEFEEEAKAKAFREGVQTGKDPAQLAKELGGKFTPAKEVEEGKLPPILAKVVFGDAPKEKTAAGQLSDVLKVGDKSYQVVLVKSLTPARQRTFEEVKAEARALALAEKRAKAAQAWLEELKKKAKLENRLNKVLAELAPKKKTEAAPKNETAPAKDGKTAEPAPKGQ